MKRYAMAWTLMISRKKDFMRTWFGLCIGIVGIVAGVCSDGRAENGMGPMQIRNQFPLHWMFLTPLPDSPDLLPAHSFRGDLALDYASMFVMEGNAHWAVLMDMETTVCTLSGAYGLTSYLTLAYRLPVIGMQNGFMDGFLENYHNFLGLPNYGRENRPKNEFAYSLQKDGRMWFATDSTGFHLADSVLTAKFPLARENSRRKFAAAISYAVKIPTGDPEAGTGSGHWDHGLFLHGKWSAGDFIFYLNGGGALIADPETKGAEIDTRPLGSGFLGIEYRWLEKWSLLGQISAYTSPLEKTDLEKLDHPSVELDLGAIGRLTDHMDLELTFGEDLIGSGAPDFVLHARLAYHFKKESI